VHWDLDINVLVDIDWNINVSFLLSFFNNIIRNFNSDLNWDVSVFSNWIWDFYLNFFSYWIRYWDFNVLIDINWVWYFNDNVIRDFDVIRNFDSSFFNDFIRFFNSDFIRDFLDFNNWVWDDFFDSFGNSIWFRYLNFISNFYRIWSWD